MICLDLGEMSVITDDNEREDLFTNQTLALCSALKGTVYECRQAVASYPCLPMFFIIKAWVRG